MTTSKPTSAQRRCLARGWAAALALLWLATPSWSEPPNHPPGPPHGTGRYSTSLEGCAQRGGTVARSPRRSYCRIAYPDGGRACTDGAQCMGACLYRPAAGGSPFQRPKGGASGICQVYNAIYGCFGRVENGRVAHTMCAD